MGKGLFRWKTDSAVFVEVANASQMCTKSAL